jgi:hypothetical protein
MIFKDNKYKDIKSFHVLLALSASLFFSACGGSGSHFTDSKFSTQEKQFIAKISVDSTNLFNLISLIVTTADSVKGVNTGSTLLACEQGGSGIISIINTHPIETFDTSDLILIDAKNCVDSNGIGRNGQFSVSGEGTKLIGEFRNYGDSTHRKLNGKITVTPTSNYDPRTGTGSLQVNIEELIGEENGKTTAIKDGTYRIVLSGNSYIYTIDQKIESSQFDGVAQIRTNTQGLTGSTSYSANKLLVSNPVSGEMTIFFPNDNTGEVFANNGDSSTYNLAVDGETISVPW